MLSPRRVLTPRTCGDGSGEGEVVQPLLEVVRAAAAQSSEGERRGAAPRTRSSHLQSALDGRPGPAAPATPATAAWLPRGIATPGRRARACCSAAAAVNNSCGSRCGCILPELRARTAAGELVGDTATTAARPPRPPRAARRRAGYPE